jgi:hypothetical protein
VGRIPAYILVVFMTAALLIALSGCASSTEQQTVVVPLRDDATAPDVETLRNTLEADDRVDACVYTHESIAPAQAQTPAVAETSGPEGDALAESWLEITLAAGLTEAERDSLLESLEANPVFDRTVLVTAPGNWWSVK